MQGLRFIAAMMVVVSHAINRAVPLYPDTLDYHHFLEAGVDIFFVISGFIMVYIIKPDSKPFGFWLQRFTRIAPLYWLFTIVAVVGGMLAPTYFFGPQTPQITIQSLLFVPVGDNMWAHPVVGPGWSLIYEFAFYTILSVCLLLGRKPFLAATMVIVLIVALGMATGRSIAWIGFYSDETLMLEFLLGMAAAVLVRERTIPPMLGFVLAAAGLVLIALIWDNPALKYPRGIGIGLPAFLVVCGVLISEPVWRRHRALQYLALLGDASYSIYITHYFLVQAIDTFFRDHPALRDAVGPYVFTALIVLCGLVFGVLTHLFVEKPLLAAVRRGLAPRPDASPAAAKV